MGDESYTGKKETTFLMTILISVSSQSQSVPVSTYLSLHLFCLKLGELGNGDS